MAHFVFIKDSLAEKQNLKNNWNCRLLESKDLILFTPSPIHLGLQEYINQADIRFKLYFNMADDI